MLLNQLLGRFLTRNFLRKIRVRLVSSEVLAVEALAVRGLLLLLAVGVFLEGVEAVGSLA